MTDTPPDWVLIEAGKKCGWHISLDQLQYEYHNEEVYRALCDMIAKHEQKPIDRKLLCAREAMATQKGGVVDAEAYRSGKRDEGFPVTDCLRAIELWEEGFGK